MATEYSLVNGNWSDLIIFSSKSFLVYDWWELIISFDNGLRPNRLSKPTITQFGGPYCHICGTMGRWVNNGFCSLLHQPIEAYPDNKVHGVKMGPTWVLSAPDGPHVGPMNVAIRVYLSVWCMYIHMEYCKRKHKSLAAGACQLYIDGLVQERRHSSASAMELRLSCTNPSICFCINNQCIHTVSW